MIDYQLSGARAPRSTTTSLPRGVQFPGRTFIAWFSGGKFSRRDGGDGGRNPARRWSSRKRNGRNAENVTERAKRKSERGEEGEECDRWFE